MKPENMSVTTQEISDQRLRIRAYNREWYRKNAERRRAASLRHQKNNRDAANARNRTYYHSTRAQQYRDNPALYLFSVAKKRAKKFGIEFTISVADIVVPKKCPILGTDIDVLTSNSQTGASLDRIDNSKGYVPGNVAVISRKANRVKSDASIDILEAIIAYMKKAMHGE